MRGLPPWRWPLPGARGGAARRVLWAVLLVAVTALVYASASLPREVDLKVGQVAPRTILSPRTIVDVVQTSARRAAAAGAVQPVYTTNPGITANALGAFQGALAEIAQTRGSLQAPAPSSAVSAPGSSASSGRAATTAGGTAARLAAAVSALRQNLGLSAPLPAADYQALLLASADTLSAAEQGASKDLAATLGAGVETAGLASARTALAARVGLLQGPPGLGTILGQLAAQDLVVNRSQDPVATAAKQKQVEAEVPPVTLARGQVIVRAGDPVTQEDLVNLRTAGLLRPGGRFGLLAGALLFSLLLAGLCWAYLARFYPRPLGDEIHLVLFGAVLVLTLAMARFGQAISPFLAPVAWAGMLATAAFGPAAALFVAGVAALGVGVLNGSLPVAIAAGVGGATAVFALRRLTQRADLLRAGLFSALAGAGTTALVLGLLLGPAAGLSGSSGSLSAEPALWQEVLASAVTGLLSAVLAIGTLPLAEALGVLTPFRLLELANAGNPLLRRLMAEAPGTYHHSLMVANLSEAACQAVGGDALLVRAAAYYHDVGKLKRPAYFVENQMGGQNPHDALAPHLSARVITAHVRDGVELARRAHLPPEIVAFIRSHHGTTLVRYFYHAARTAAERALAEGHPAEAVSEADFRYEGPLPDTRETAIVMLADGVEAAVRSLKRPTAEQIEELIARIVGDRLQDGQLDRAALTLQEVNTISVTFRRILVGAYHARIEYPEQLAAEVGGASAQAAPARQGLPG